MQRQLESLAFAAVFLCGIAASSADAQILIDRTTSIVVSSDHSPPAAAAADDLAADNSAATESPNR